MSDRAGRMLPPLSVSPVAPPPSLCFSLRIFLHTLQALLPSLSNILPTGSLSCSSLHSSSALARTPPLSLPPFDSLAPRIAPSLSLFLFAPASYRSTHRSVVSSLPLIPSASLICAASRPTLPPSTPPLPSPASSLCFSSRIALRCIPLTQSTLLPSPQISSSCRIWIW